jgi:hypothetical protein
MTDINSIRPQELLDALGGVAYWVDLDSRIQAVTKLSWQEFARNNGGEAIADPASVIGRSLFDFMDGEETKRSYRTLQDAARTLTGRGIDLRYRCDSPSVQREMQMYLTVVRHEGEPVGYLYHSYVVWQERRDTAGIQCACGIADSSTKPYLMICSYCKRVRYPAGQADGSWVQAETYYRMGGSDEIVPSHGVCPECHEAIVVPAQNLMRRRPKP